MTTIIAILTALMLSTTPVTNNENTNPDADPIDGTEWVGEEDIIGF